MALERTLVSRMFTEPAPLVHFTREQSPPPPDAVRRGGPRTSGQVRPRARGHTGQQDSRHRTPCFPARRMETSPELEGHLQNPLSDSTSPAWKFSEDLEKRILFASSFFFSPKGFAFVLT